MDHRASDGDDPEKKLERECELRHRFVARRQVHRNLGDLYTESGQTLQGSFSAVSTPIFASKYALESSRRDLHNALLCTVLESNPKKRGKPWGGTDPSFAPFSMLKIFVKNR